jgi:hypothetical protein
MNGEETASPEADPRDNLVIDMNRRYGVAGYMRGWRVLSTLPSVVTASSENSPSSNLCRIWRHSSRHMLNDSLIDREWDDGMLDRESDTFLVGQNGSIYFGAEVFLLCNLRLVTTVDWTCIHKSLHVSNHRLYSRVRRCGVWPIRS